MRDDHRTPPSEDIDLIPELQRHFAMLEDRFAQLKTEVRQAMQLSALGTATAVWAHELNNLITPMLSFARFALDDDDVELMKKALRITVTNAETIEAMSERILGLSARESAPKPRRVNLARAIELAVACLGRDLSKDGIKLIVDVPGHVEAWIDPHVLQQVLFNLVLNARDAMAKSHGGILSITALEADGGGVRVRVKDTGGGIPPERLPHVFEPFCTSKPTGRNGTARFGGVGLSLSRQLIEDCGGRIEAQSQPGVGTTFVFTLPGQP